MKKSPQQAVTYIHKGARLPPRQKPTVVKTLITRSCPHSIPPPNFFTECHFAQLSIPIQKLASQCTNVLTFVCVLQYCMSWQLNMHNLLFGLHIR